MGVSWRTTSLEIGPSYGYFGHGTHDRQQKFRSGRTLLCAGCCSHLHEELKIPSIGAGFEYDGQLFNFGGGHFSSVYVIFPS